MERIFLKYRLSCSLLFVVCACLLAEKKSCEISQQQNVAFGCNLILISVFSSLVFTDIHTPSLMRFTLFSLNTRVWGVEL